MAAVLVGLLSFAFTCFETLFRILCDYVNGSDAKTLFKSDKFNEFLRTRYMISLWKHKKFLNTD